MNHSLMKVSGKGNGSLDLLKESNTYGIYAPSVITLTITPHCAHKLVVL